MQGTREREAGRIRGVHVLYGMLAFFGLIFAVNGVFLYQALATHTGVVSKQPYRKGLDYNSRIAADERQKRLGWQEAVRFDRGAGQLMLTIKDRSGAPVTGLKVAGMMGRPATQQHDITVEMTERQSGQYVATVGDRADGVWLVALKARRGRGDAKGVVYRLRKRLWLK